jgi:hypothetical protein
MRGAGGRSRATFPLGDFRPAPEVAIIAAETNEQADSEATWHRRRAIELAGEYWKSEDGVHEVESREKAISDMRNSIGLSEVPIWPSPVKQLSPHSGAWPY